VKGYVVSTWSKDKALAQQFIEFINQPQYVKARYVATGEIPPLKAMIDDPVIKNDEKPARSRCRRARRCRAFRRWAKCGAGNAALELSLTGKQAPQAALDNAVKQIKMKIAGPAISNRTCSRTGGHLPFVEGVV
jgi:arabinogalactan oligomer/maltooligosaccharide transport system substrate-binding protein